MKETESLADTKFTASSTTDFLVSRNEEQSHKLYDILL